MGLALDGAHHVAVGDFNNVSVRLLDLGAMSSSTLAGGANLGAKDGTGPGAQFSTVIGTAFDATGGVLYVTDAANYAIRAITVPGGVVTTPFSDITNPQSGLVNGGRCLAAVAESPASPIPAFPAAWECRRIRWCCSPSSREVSAC